MTIWLTIAGMAVVTFASRVLALVFMRHEIAPWIQRWLGYVPIAIFVALIIPALVPLSTEAPRITLGPSLPAGLVGAVVAWRTSNVIYTIIAGLITFWLLRWAGF